MRKIIYYVAASLDGFISGLNDDVSQFIYEGNGVEKYLEDLKSFDTVIMGRKTYEFGYNHGLKPGQPAYPNMEHYIFSNSLTFETSDKSVHIEKLDLNKIKELKESSDENIYLCGGGDFAGWLLDNGMIDTLKIKLNPIIIGEGVPLFGSSTTKANLKLISSEKYDHGLQIIEFYLK